MLLGCDFFLPPRAKSEQFLLKTNPFPFNKNNSPPRAALLDSQPPSEHTEEPSLVILRF